MMYGTRLTGRNTIVAAAIAATFFACGSDGAPGAQGVPGAPGDPGTPSTGSTTIPASAGLVTPNKGVLDREVDVSIGGDATNFDEGTKPDFGPGVTVDKVIVSSPTLLTAHLTIAKDAEVGTRDVKLGDIVAKDAFTVIPAVELAGAGGGAAQGQQGSLVQFAITNNDSKAFDPNTFGVVTPGFLDLGTTASTAQQATGLLLAAPLQPAGKFQLEVGNIGDDGSAKVSFLTGPGALEIKSRAPEAITVGTPKEDTFAKPLETKFYKDATPATPFIVEYRVETTASDPNVPMMFVYGPGGQDKDLLTRQAAEGGFFGSPPPYDLRAAVPHTGATAIDRFIIVLDQSGTPGAKATITATHTPASLYPESGSAHGQDAPQELVALPAANGQIVDGELKAGETDAYRVTGEDGDTVQLAVSAEADVFVYVTKDPTDLDGDASFGYFPLDKGTTQSAALPFDGITNLYLVVKAQDDAATPAGKYVVSARKLPSP